MKRVQLIRAMSAPDGYTLFLGTLGNLSVNKHLYPAMSVDPLRDFAEPEP